MVTAGALDVAPEARRSRVVRAAAVVWLALAAVLVGCESPKTVPAGQADSSAPRLHLGSAGLRADIHVTESASEAVTRRMLRNGGVLLIAEANDTESGIATVTLSGPMTIECIPIPNTGNKIVRIADPIFTDQTSTGSSLPVLGRAAYGITVADQIARCPASTRFHQLTATIRARARNGAGLQQELPEVQLHAYGPDKLRVATFNLHNPGNYPDSQFVSWGTEIGKVADVVLLTEVRDRRTAELLANAAGMPYVVLKNDQDTEAIASRWGFRKVKREVVSPGPGRLDSRLSNILSVESDIANYPHQLVVNHWAIRDANDAEAPGDISAPGRLQAANTVLGLLSRDDIPVIVGGDLNAYAQTNEVRALAASLADAFVASGAQDSAHCSNQRIDYLFSRGSITPTEYSGCHSFAEPSDHPFVVVTYLPR